MELKTKITLGVRKDIEFSSPLPIEMAFSRGSLAVSTFGNLLIYPR